jgi:hypothetical protein
MEIANQTSPQPSDFREDKSLAALRQEVKICAVNGYSFCLSLDAKPRYT